jgi:hypothetical protein
MMGVNDTYKIVLGSARSAESPDVDSRLSLNLEQQFRQDAEFERSQDINLADLFFKERQSSDIFRPSTKITFLFDNSYIGETNYGPFRNNLYYVNAVSSSIETCNSNQPDTVFWSGYPQYFEFDLIRTDSEVQGYTIPGVNPITSPHIDFETSKSTSYNWNFYLSYAYENDSTKVLECQNPFFNNISHSWTSGDGIPFVIQNSKFNGHPVIFLYCALKHSLSVGEFVELSFSYNGTNLFSVDYLGDGSFESEQYVVGLVDVGYVGNTFANNVTGTLRRVINSEHPIDTRSSYYVRKHKFLTNPEDAVITNAGFELNPFRIEKKFEPQQLTPNRRARLSIKNNCQTYTLSFNRDIKLNNLVDNQLRPVTELFFTNIWIGTFGWTMKPVFNNVGLRQGFSFNLQLVNNQPSQWWTTNQQQLNTNSLTNLQLQSYTKGNKTFYYNQAPLEGDLLDGPLCEWNNYTLNEVELSQIYHKFTFNDNVFNINLGPLSNSNTNPLGYYYAPYNKIKIKDFSSYIEEAESKEYEGIPSYALFSENSTTFRWRDIYSYGFIDEVGFGVDYPFLNGAHYPFEITTFRLIPEGSNENIFINVIQDPTTDECE